MKRGKINEDKVEIKWVINVSNEHAERSAKPDRLLHVAVAEQHIPEGGNMVSMNGYRAACAIQRVFAEIAGGDMLAAEMRGDVRFPPV